MSNQSLVTDEIQISNIEPASNADVFYTSWGEELLRSSVKALNEANQRMVTLATALLGGSIAFLDARVIDPLPRAMSMLFFFLTLLAGLWGSFPYGTKHLCVSDPDAVKAFATHGVSRKSNLLKAGSVTIALGLLVAALGYFMKYHSGLSLHEAAK